MDYLYTFNIIDVEVGTHKNLSGEDLKAFNIKIYIIGFTAAEETIYTGLLASLKVPLSVMN